MPSPKFVHRLMAQNPAVVADATGRNISPILPPMAFAQPELERRRILAQTTLAEKELAARMLENEADRRQREREREQNRLNQQLLLQHEATEAEKERQLAKQLADADRVTQENIAKLQAQTWKDLYQQRVNESAHDAADRRERQRAAYEANGYLLRAQTLTDPKERAKALRRAEDLKAAKRLEFDQESGLYHDGEGNTGPPGWRGVRNIFWQRSITPAPGQTPVLPPNQTTPEQPRLTPATAPSGEPGATAAPKPGFFQRWFNLKNLRPVPRAAYQMQPVSPDMPAPEQPRLTPATAPSGEPGATAAPKTGFIRKFLQRTTPREIQVQLQPVVPQDMTNPQKFPFMDLVTGHVIPQGLDVTTFIDLKTGRAYTATPQEAAVARRFPQRYLEVE